MLDVCEYVPIVKSVVRSLRSKGLPWWADAEDLQSIGVLALIEKPVPDAALARKVAHSAIVNAIKAEAVRQRDRVDDAPVSDECTSLIDSVDWPCEEPPDTELLWKLAAKLPPQVYSIMVLKFQFGYSSEEIAEQCDMKTGTIDSAVSRALSTLRDNVQDACKILRRSTDNTSAGIESERKSARLQPPIRSEQRRLVSAAAQVNN